MSLRSQFLLDPSVVYLNHGSFGACPKPVFEDYQHWQRQLEMEPVQFITRTAPQQLEVSKTALATYIGCEALDLVFTPNPTYAINIIAKSLNLKPGDEILSTDLEYGAMDKTWEYYCEQYGAKYIRQPITLPIADKEQILEAFWKGYSPRTKAIFISHITSTTGLILPVQEICEKAKSLGLMTIVDGAHVPAHIPLNLSTLPADIYTGACHKWMLTPKGCSFLYVKRELQPTFDPLLISWGYKAAQPSVSQFWDYHEQQGTRDVSAFLTVPKALDFLEANNWDAVSTHCRQGILSIYEELCDIADSAPICPVNEEFLGQMCSIPVNTQNPMQLKQQLFDTYRIEIPVMPWQNKAMLRVSWNAYNSLQDIEELKKAMKALLA